MKDEQEKIKRKHPHKRNLSPKMTHSDNSTKKSKKERVNQNRKKKGTSHKSSQEKKQTINPEMKRNRPKKKRKKKTVIKRNKRNQVLEKGWNLIFYGFIAVMLLGAVMFAFNDSDSKSFFGYRFMTVKTNSMAQKKDRPKYKDGFEAGAMIFLKSIPPEELKVEDVITYKPFEGEQEVYLTHRLIKIDKELNGEEGLFFTTQGDANNNPDSPIRSNQYVGKVMFHIDYIGRIIQFIRDKLIIVLVLLCAIFAFSLTIKYYLSLPTVSSKSV